MANRKLVENPLQTLVRFPQHGIAEMGDIYFIHLCGYDVWMYAHHFHLEYPNDKRYTKRVPIVRPQPPIPPPSHLYMESAKKSSTSFQCPIYLNVPTFSVIRTHILRTFMSIVFPFSVKILAYTDDRLALDGASMVSPSKLNDSVMLCNFYDMLHIKSCHYLV